VTGYLHRLLVHVWYRLLVHVDSDKLTVTTVDLVTMIGCLYLAFIFQGGR
jgi:hypothetical protein